MKKLFCLIIAIVVLLAMAAGCATDPAPTVAPAAPAVPDAPPAQDEAAAEAPQELRQLRVAVQPFFISAQVGFIMDQGWDREAGIEIVPILFANGALMNEALAADLWDVATIGGAFVFGVANFNAKVIGSHISGTGGNDIYTFADSPIAQVVGANPTFPNVLGDPDTVRGATILQTAGTTSQLAIMRWLEAIGVREGEVDIVHLEFPQAWQALQMEQGEVAALVAPFSLQAYADDTFVRVASLEDLATPLYEQIVASRRAYENMQEELKIFLQLMFRANDVLEADFELKVENVQRWLTENGIDVDEDAVRQESMLKPYVTTAQALEMGLGDFQMAFAEFQVLIERLEPHQLAVVEANIRPNLLFAALE